MKKTLTLREQVSAAREEVNSWPDSIKKATKINHLPFDISRCHGTTASICEYCRLREPGRDDWQSFIAPAVISNNAVQNCPNYIAPEQVNGDMVSKNIN